MSLVISFATFFISSTATVSDDDNDAFDFDISAAGVKSEDAASPKISSSSPRRFGSVFGIPESSGFKVGIPLGPITKFGRPPPHKSIPPENAAVASLTRLFKTKPASARASPNCSSIFAKADKLARLPAGNDTKFCISDIKLMSGISGSSGINPFMSASKTANDAVSSLFKASISPSNEP